MISATANGAIIELEPKTLLFQQAKVKSRREFTQSERYCFPNKKKHIRRTIETNLICEAADEYFGPLEDHQCNNIAENRIA